VINGKHLNSSHARYVLNNLLHSEGQMNDYDISEWICN